MRQDDEMPPDSAAEAVHRSDFRLASISSIKKVPLTISHKLCCFVQGELPATKATPRRATIMGTFRC